MTEERPDIDPRMESLLQAWGADEAISRARRLRLHPPVLRRPVVMAAARWGPLAAGLVLALGAAVYVVTSAHQLRSARMADGASESVANAEHEPSRQPAVTPTPTTAPASSPAGPSQLQDLIAEVRQLKGQLAIAQMQLGESQDQVDDLKREGEELMAAILARAQKVEDVEKKAKEQVRELDAQIQALVKEKAGETQKVSALSLEVDRLRTLHSQAMAAQKKAAQELADTRAEHQALTADLQRVFLAAAAGKSDVAESDLTARKAAVTHYKMAARAASARRDASAEPQRLLVDKIEATLLRLELLDVNDSAAVRAFQKSLAAPNLVKQIDDALLASPAPAMRVWLVESRMILSGAEHAE